MNTKENFRDRIATVNEEGKRNFIFPKKPSGKFYDKRKILSYFLLGFLLSSPFIYVNGNQFMLFNVVERKFSLFGVPFWPQDFYLFVIIMITSIVGLTLFTVAFGRIFCGWFCPQTIFMEMLFRRIEYLIEGDRGQQIKLEKQEWNAEKIRKRITKWIVFFLISFLIANVFLSYLIGSERLLGLINNGPFSDFKIFISLLIFTVVFYLVFAWFREQVCVIACPYGRLQGVLLDDKSIVVAYDHVRGEGEKGRAKFKKNEDRQSTGFGDCIDCKQCVNVCPTGIDIRNGTQLECVNCTACIDECDFMMDSVGLPKGLIRYASEEEIVNKKKFEFTLRMKGYTVVLTILLGLMVTMFALRSQLDTTILKLPGQLYQEKNGIISNVYTFKILNKTNETFKNVSFKIRNKEGKLIVVGNSIFDIKKSEMKAGTLFIELPENKLEGENTKIKIDIYSDDKLIETTKTNFLGPRSFF